MADRRPLAALAAVIRFSDEPQWLALEWTDGAAPTMYITPSRDGLLTAVLDTAQVQPLCKASHQNLSSTCPLKGLHCKIRAPHAR